MSVTSNYWRIRNTETPRFELINTSKFIDVCVLKNAKAKSSASKRDKLIVNITRRARAKARSRFLIDRISAR